MKLRMTRLSAALALLGPFAGCKDSSSAPAASRAAGQTPTFATAADSGGGPGQSHFIANGTSGSVNWTVFAGAPAPGDTGGGGGFTFGQLNVSRGGTVNQPQTFLFYVVQQCDAFFSCSFMEGSGLIPNSDLSDAGQQLRLATNTTGNPDFFTYGGPTGLVAVAWKANGLFEQRSSGTLEQISPGFRQHFSGASSAVSADAAGSVVGLPVPPASPGTIGTNHSVSIQISH